MGKGDKKKKKFRGLEKSKMGIIGKGSGKRHGKGKKLEAVAMGMESHSSSVYGLDAPKKDTCVMNDGFSGYIFLCNGKTKPECFVYRVFGLPSFRIDVVAKIKRNTKLFLFDFDVKLLYGVYVASSTGTMSMEPHAFRGKFPAQVKFEIFLECMPLPESKFKHVITYQGGSKFRQDLSANQVDELISLFRPLFSSSPAPRISLLPNELQSRRILHQEIEKQIQLNGNSSPVLYQASESQYICSTSPHSSHLAPHVNLPFYDYEGLPTSVYRVHEQRSVIYQHFPVSSLLPQNNSYLSETFQQAYVPHYSATIQSLSERQLTSVYQVHEQPSVLYQHSQVSRLVSENRSYFPEHSQQLYIPEYPTSTQRLSSRRETNVPFHTRIDVNPAMGPTNGYYQYTNQDSRQRHGQIQTEKQISAHPVESDRRVSSVLADAYWAAVASEIPQPSGIRNSDSDHSMTGQTSMSQSLQHKPPNLTSASILDAYWKAKAFEDSHQIEPHQLSVVGSNSQVTPYRLAPASGDQNWLHYSYKQSVPNTEGAVSNTMTEVESQASALASVSHHQAYYPAQPHLQVKQDIPHPYVASLHYEQK